MKRLVAKWREPDPPNKPRKRMLISPLYRTKEEKQNAFNWIEQRLTKEPFGTYARYSIIEQELTLPPSKA